MFCVYGLVSELSPNNPSMRYRRAYFSVVCCDASAATMQACKSA
jgi:hypothetical protein